YSDQKFRRADPELDRAELSALDHARNGTELACRIDLRLDATVGVFFNRSRKALQPFVLCIVEGRGGELDGRGFLLGVSAAGKRRKERGDEQKRERAQVKSRAQLCFF